MVTLNDYLYSGDTMFKILKNYSQDLKKEAKCTDNEIDLMHAPFEVKGQKQDIPLPHGYKIPGSSGTGQ